MHSTKPTTFPHLEESSLFRELSPAEMKKLTQHARRKSLESGEFLFMEGDDANRFYILEKGRIKLSLTTQDGQQVILQYIGPGEAFAVVAVISGIPYPVTAEAVEDSQVIGWDSQLIKDLMLEIPRLALNALEILARKTREFQDRLREMATERVERRIARTLIRLARQSGRKTEEGVLIDIPLSRQNLAEMNGTTLYTVSRILSQWEEKGLIRAGREQVTILFPHGLVAVAEDLAMQGKE
jgi:CRP-like cAMP-binding protein